MSSARLLALTLLIAMPQVSYAAVYINEIAWMGNSENANAEWIELYNDGTEEVALGGWKITSSGTAPNITIESGKVIAAGGYFLLERTGDHSAPPPMDQMYTGALSNSGDTLTLSDASGIPVDSVLSTIAGSNVTKHTAQRVGSSWITAAPTPKAQNATSETTETETATTTEPVATSTPTVTIGGTAPTPTTSESPANKLFLDAGRDRIVPAQVATPFRAVAYTKGGNIRNDATITWNFGDGTREIGEEVLHTFQHPGTYAVVVRARDDAATVLQTLRVVVEKYDVTAVATPDGVLVTNNAAKLIDLSGWELAQEESVFVIPEDTALWPGSEILFVPLVTGLLPTVEVALRYPSGKTADIAEVMEDPVVVEEELVVAVEDPAPQPPAPTASSYRVRAVVPTPAPISNEAVYEESVTAPTEPKLEAAVGAAVPQAAIRPSWVMCLFGNLLACGASFVVP